MSDDWCCLLFSVLLMALPQQLTFGISVFRSLHQREWPSRTDPNPQAPLSSLQVVRWKTKTFVCSSRFVTGALWPNSLHCFGGKYTNLVLKQFWLKEFNYAGAIILVAGCSVSCMPGFVLVTHQGQRTDGYWNTLCVTLPHPPKCCSLLAGICCPRAARHSTAWCKWRALCKWSNIFATSVLGSHATFLFHPYDSYFPSHHCLINIPFNNSKKTNILHIVYIKFYTF